MKKHARQVHCIGLKAWFEEDDDAAQQGCNDTDCGQSAHLHPHQLPAHLPLSHSQHQQYQQPGMYPDAAHQLLSSPMACDHLHQPHASYNHHGDEVAHQSDLAYGQQYEEEGEHMVLEDQSQACMMDQQHQHQHLAPQELYMQGLQYEACQRQYSQQDEMMVMNESEQENVAPNGQLLCQASSQSHSWVRQNAVTPEPPAGAQEQYQTQCSGQAAVIAISTLKSSLAAMQKRTICSLVHQNDLLGRHFATQLLCCLKVSCILCIC